MSDNKMCPACGGTVGFTSPNRWECCCNGKLYHGTVVNAAPELIGKTALMRNHESDCDLIMLQFDDMTLEYEGKFLASGWHTFHRDSFETDEERVERGIRALVKILVDGVTPTVIGIDFSRSTPLYHTGGDDLPDDLMRVISDQNMRR